MKIILKILIKFTFRGFGGKLSPIYEKNFQKGEILGLEGRSRPTFQKIVYIDLKPPFCGVRRPGSTPTHDF